MMDYKLIKKYLKDGFEKDFFDACIRNLADEGNPLRLSNFSYSLRELIREVLSDRAPDERIRNCECVAFPKNVAFPKKLSSMWMPCLNMTTKQEVLVTNIGLMWNWH